MGISVSRCAPIRERQTISPFGLIIRLPTEPPLQHSTGKNKTIFNMFIEHCSYFISEKRFYHLSNQHHSNNFKQLHVVPGKRGFISFLKYGSAKLHKEVQLSTGKTAGSSFSSFITYFLTCALLCLLYSRPLHEVLFTLVLYIRLTLCYVHSLLLSPDSCNLHVTYSRLPVI